MRKGKTCVWAGTAVCLFDPLMLWYGWVPATLRSLATVSLQERGLSLHSPVFFGECFFTVLCGSKQEVRHDLLERTRTQVCGCGCGKADAGGRGWQIPSHFLRVVTAHHPQQRTTLLSTPTKCETNSGPLSLPFFGHSIVPISTLDVLTKRAFDLGRYSCGIHICLMPEVRCHCS